MIRFNGFIELDDILDLDDDIIEIDDLKELTKVISNNKDIIITKIRNDKFKQLIFKYIYDGDTYYYKYDADVSPYMELVVEELAKLMGIESISYDLASIGSYFGVISKDFKSKNASYINGTDILFNYYHKLDENIGLSSRQIGLKYNSLENIWYALEYRYKNKINSSMIVSKIMNKLVKIFILDILTGQVDRHSNNWMIVEYDNGEVDLQKLFDNGRAFYELSKNMRVCLLAANDLQQLPSKNIEYFVKVSSEEYIDMLKSSLWVISPESINIAINNVENKIGAPLDISFKEGFAKMASIYYDYYQNYINNELVI